MKNYSGVQFFFYRIQGDTYRERNTNRIADERIRGRTIPNEKTENKTKLCTTDWGEWLKMMESKRNNDDLRGCLERGQTRIWESVLVKPEVASFRRALVILTILEWSRKKVERFWRSCIQPFHSLDFFFQRLFKYTAEDWRLRITIRGYVSYLYHH